MRLISKITKTLILFTIVVCLISSMMVSYAAPVKERPWDSYVNSSDRLRDKAVSSAGAAILVDAKSGRILYGNSHNQVMQPASITKIMTALLTVENTRMSDIVTIDNEMAEEIMRLEKDAKLCGFQKGETVRVEDLLYGLMLISGADASVALAIHVAGSYDGFIEMMNKKAQELGMTKTSFRNPHGLYQSGHVTSATDMARLAIYANKFPSFVKVVSSGYYTPPDTDKHTYSDDGYRWRNSNKLVTNDKVYGYDYATGMKTGFTTPAQHTLVTSAEKDEQSLIGVVLKDTTNGKWRNSITMFEYGFLYYDTIDLTELFNKDDITSPVKNAASTIEGSDLIMQLAPDTKIYLTEKRALCDQIRANPSQYFTSFIEYDQEPLIAPIKKGDYIGQITYTYSATHSYDDYVEASPTGSAIKEIVFVADLIAANNIGAVPMVSPEPTAVPDGFGNADDTSLIETIQESATNPVVRTTLVILLIIVALFSGMALYSFVDRHLRYQQYSNRQKTIKPRHKGKK